MSLRLSRFHGFVLCLDQILKTDKLSLRVCAQFHDNLVLILSQNGVVQLQGRDTDRDGLFLGHIRVRTL